MARKKSKNVTEAPVPDYRYGAAKRKNIPPGGEWLEKKGKKLISYLYSLFHKEGNIISPFEKGGFECNLALLRHNRQPLVRGNLEKHYGEVLI